MGSTKIFGHEKDNDVLNERFVMPRYDGRSIGNIGATLLKIFGVQSNNDYLLPPIDDEPLYELANGKDRIAVVLLDALGYKQLMEAIGLKSMRIFKTMAEKGRLLTLTSTFPSTTSTAIASFWTGAAPASHMVLGYHVFLREFDVVTNMLKMSPRLVNEFNVLRSWGLEPESFVPVSSIPEILGQNDIDVQILMNSYIIESGFSDLAHRGIEAKNGTKVLSDLWVVLKDVLNTPHRAPELVVAYWSGIDSVAHHYGPLSEQWYAELESIAYLIEHQFIRGLSAEAKKRTLLMITADHGQIYSPKEELFELKDVPEIANLLLMRPTGEVRHRYLHAISGMESELYERLNEKFASHGIKFFKAEDAVSAGFYGKPFDPFEVRRRIGDVIGVSLGVHGISWNKDDDELVGRHGGATEDEMLIPLIVVDLNEF